MDYSYNNASLWNSIIQLGIIALSLLIANILIRKIKFFRNSLLPTAAVAGFLVLILRELGVLKIDASFMEFLIYHGIALGFIAMALRIPTGVKEQKGNMVGIKSGAIIIGSYLIQGIVGLVISIGLSFTLMSSMSQNGAFQASGILLAMAFGQGTGQANNVGGMYEGAVPGFIGGRSFALSLAAAGYLVACIVGVVVLNILAKKGKIKRYSQVDKDEAVTVESFQDKNEIPFSESIDRFTVQVALVFVVYLATYLCTWGITSALHTYLPAVDKLLSAILWGFNFIGGTALAILTRVIVNKLTKVKLVTRQYQNNYLLSRLSGLFFDIMIVAGIAVINIDDLKGLWLMFILMAVLGGAITWYYLKIVCKRVYKGYFYEGLFSMYGMMIGPISSGILLLREIDPNFETPAANNLIIGSSYAIILGAPLLVLIGMAYQSTLMAFVVLGLIVAYFALINLFIFKAHRRVKK
jgi:ESS family glutamate:Na+ symporter